MSGSAAKRDLRELTARSGRRNAGPMGLGLAVVLALIVVLAVGGYVGGWSWTGFSGNTLWDWLHLFILPVVLALLPLWLKTHDRDARRWRLLLLATLLTLGMLIVGGYGLGWAWTGFTGNTVWDWLELLVLPFVLPVVVARLDRPLPPAPGTAPRATPALPPSTTVATGMGTPSPGDGNVAGHGPGEGHAERLNPPEA